MSELIVSGESGLARKSIVHGFADKLAFSLGERETFDMDLLKSAIFGCVEVRKTDDDTDRGGVDYIATLRRGTEILIDAKARESGASRWWKGEPELALEKWSVCPDERWKGKAGWTLNESSPVDMVLFTFDPADHPFFYLLPFQHLRMAFIRNMGCWQERYITKRQRSDRWGGWQSEAVFVPARAVLAAVTREMYGKTA